MSGNGFQITDLNSSNGCYVNQRKVEQAVLSNGDRLQVGHTLMIFTNTAADLKTRPVQVSLQKKDREGSRIIRSIRHEEGSQIFLPTKLREEGQSDELQNNLQIIYDTALAVSRTLDITQLLDYLLGLIFNWVEADRACIVLLDEQTKKPEAKAQRVRQNKEGVDDSITISHTILDFVLTNGEGVLTTDAQEDERWSPEGSIINYGVNEAICVPMQGRYGVVGAIYIDTHIPSQIASSSTKARFNEDHLKLMIAIAHQAALAVEDTHYYSAVVKSERLAAMGQAVTAISHHVKNILQGIQGGNYIVEEGIKANDIEIIKQGWTIVSRNQDRISHLVMDMLSFSKEREPERREANLNDVTEDVVNLLRIRASECKVVLEFRPELEIPLTMLDEEGIHRAALNVVTNAIDACRDIEDARVIVETEFLANDKMMQIRISDNGPGISFDLQEKIFSAFESTKGNRGTGLGLPVTKKIIEEHGGRIVLESQPGSGTVFKLQIPYVHNPIRETL